MLDRMWFPRPARTSAAIALSYALAGAAHAAPREFVAIDLGTLGGTYTVTADNGLALSDSGQVVGSSSVGSGDNHAYLWTEQRGMIDLGTLGGAWSEGLAVNDRGQVVGVSSTAAGEYHAFAWTERGGMVDLGTLGGTERVNDFETPLRRV